MKKTLSLILAVMMLLGCFSITAFAGPVILPLIVGGKTIADKVGEPPKSQFVNEFGVLTGIDAITAGTVTYTAPEDNGGIDKLTLNNATITGNNSGIETVRCLEIELIGENTISYTGTIPYSGLIAVGDILFSGTGSLIIHGGTHANSYAVKTEGSITLPLGYTAVGSTSGTETDIANMTKVSLVNVQYSQYTYCVGDVPAKTVVIYNPYFDSTDITLKVAKELSYEMVIPQDVDNLNNFGIYAVGQAKVTNVKNATDNTVISYTAETTDFKCEGKSDIPASYYTDAEGATAFPTNAVEVYKNKADAASIPTMYVGISENDYNAAENGTYTATVTFNFSAEDVEAPVAVTAADALVTGAQFKVTVDNLTLTVEKAEGVFNFISIFEDSIDITEGAINSLSAVAEGSTIKLQNTSSFDWLVEIYTDRNEYASSNSDYDVTEFSVKPAGATEFTEVILTQAVPG